MIEDGDLLIVIRKAESVRLVGQIDKQWGRLSLAAPDISARTYGVFLIPTTFSRHSGTRYLEKRTMLRSSLIMTSSYISRQNLANRRMPP
ncbi:MAG: hypothetical protein IPG67_06150, partial [Acidobacteria bacterium]|nr:hypothetical protein [Acidobacteriota bacterium]